MYTRTTRQKHKELSGEADGAKAAAASYTPAARAGGHDIAFQAEDYTISSDHGSRTT